MRDSLRIRISELEAARADAVTVRREAEARQHELERQNERFDEFASVGSHDLRSPLTVASARLELAKEDCDSEQLRHATDAIERSETLVEDILTPAREGASVSELTDVALDDGFYVADDGPGNPEEDREAISESGYSTADQGTGFGLAIVEEIVQAHGWDVSVADSSDGDARFEIPGVDVPDDSSDGV